MSNTPIIKGFFTMSESFVSSSDRVTVPICPTGFKEYIFGGDKKTYCCRGTVNADATTVQGSCKRAIEKMEITMRNDEMRRMVIYFTNEDIIEIETL